MSELTAAVGGTFEFKHKDKTYQIGLITNSVKAAFEKAQFSRARDAARELKELMSKDEYLEHLKALNDDFIVGEYGLDSARGLAYAQSPKGVLLLCSLLFNVDEDEMQKLFLERKDEITSLVSVVIKESFGLQDAEEVKS